jgi:hypothetical protein
VRAVEVVKRRAEGVKLSAEMVRDTYGAAGAAAGIGVEEGTWFRTLCEKFSSMIGLL